MKPHALAWCTCRHQQYEHERDTGPCTAAVATRAFERRSGWRHTPCDCEQFEPAPVAA